MSSQQPKTPSKYPDAIKRSGLSIYDPVEVGDPDLWIPALELEKLLAGALKGLSLKGLPLRTRSKLVKGKVCEALGYDVPTTFTKTKPRFPGQNFDTYIQKANNLQIWNEEITPARRYVIIQVNEADIVGSVRVVTGDMLATLDTTGTLTQKYQARLVTGEKANALVSQEDTENLRKVTTESDPGKLVLGAPTDYPDKSSLLPIQVVYQRLSTLVGQTFEDTGFDQERNRGAALHRLACAALGYSSYRDNGQFPDIPNQLVELKLQTSPTIDLGLVSPDSEDPLDMPKIETVQVCHRDVRYALFSAEISGGIVTITGCYLVTGQDFFGRFTKFGGKEVNKKLQIPLPSDFFSGKPKAE